MSFFAGKANPDQAPEILTVKITGCKPEAGGVGLSLNMSNVRSSPALLSCPPGVWPAPAGALRPN